MSPVSSKAVSVDFKTESEVVDVTGEFEAVVEDVTTECSSSRCHMLVLVSSC